MPLEWNGTKFNCWAAARYAKIGSARWRAEKRKERFMQRSEDPTRIGYQPGAVPCRWARGNANSMPKLPACETNMGRRSWYPEDRTRRPGGTALAPAGRRERRVLART